MTREEIENTEGAVRGPLLMMLLLLPVPPLLLTPLLLVTGPPLAVEGTPTRLGTSIMAVCGATPTLPTPRARHPKAGPRSASTPA